MHARPLGRRDQGALAASLADIRHRQGRLLGRMESLGFSLQKEAELETLTLDVLKSSEIEGENLPADQVGPRSLDDWAWRRRALIPAEREVEGVVEMMLDATQNFPKPLTEERLFAWHSALFPTARSGMRKIIVGRGAMMPMGRCRSCPVRSEKRKCTTRRPRLPCSMGRCLRHRVGQRRRRQNGCGAQSRVGAPVVCDDPSVRRRQRPDRASDCRLGPRAIRGVHNVSTVCPRNPSGTQ